MIAFLNQQGTNAAASIIHSQYYNIMSTIVIATLNLHNGTFLQHSHYLRNTIFSEFLIQASTQL